MSNAVDKLVEYFAPQTAMRRQHARRVLAYYEAAKANRTQKQRRETGSGNDAIGRAGASLRQQARHFEQNYDIALGVLNTLVANVVGPFGIQPEPQPRNLDGTINDAFAKELMKLHKDWSEKPEVTWLHDWPSAQRMMARAWFRDGESFAQTIEGVVPYLDHGTRVPLSLEMLEADYVPMELQATAPQIVQGIEVNGWGRPVAFHVYKSNPIEQIGSLSTLGQTKRITAERFLHIATRHRIRQLRGVSVFASVLGRFDDLKDYEESERIAAKVAASMAAFIKKGSPDQYDPDASGDMRLMKFRPGMIFDDLRPGEEIGTIDTNRPNPNLETYRSGQVKAIAAGTGPTYSSLSKTYDGTYSAQRQELVEGWAAYATLSNEFIGAFIRPVYQKFVALAIASGQIKVPAGLDRDSIDDALFIAPQMPWIDPKKEAEAWAMLEDRAYISGPEIIRKRGGNPADVLEQQRKWMEAKEEAGIKDPELAVAEAYKQQSQSSQDDSTEETKDAVVAALAGLQTTVSALASAKPEPKIDVHNHITNQIPATQVTNIVEPTPINVENNIPAAGVTVQNVVNVPETVVNVEAVMPEQAAPTVNITNDVKPAAVQVDLNLPTRKTETTVERDAYGNLTKATQVESNLLN